MAAVFINIISFNVPFPANYGGVIDVFYKIKALHAQGIKIILHTFTYGREQSEELFKYCCQVHYYQRKTGWWAQMSTKPYIVGSRRGERLLENLLTNEYPILFEGLHSCYYLGDERLSKRLKIVRAHNIEHLYYDGLAKSSTSRLKKIYFKKEAFLLKYFEKKLSYANYILPLSTSEEQYFKEKFGESKVLLVPIFHANSSVQIHFPARPYILYHGDLSTAENIRAAIMVIDKIAKKDVSIDCVLAGLNPHKSIYGAAKGLKNVRIEANLDDEAMQILIREAAVNILYTDQVSGVKLKLINVLFNGHHCLVNSKMIEGSALDPICKVVLDDPEFFLYNIHRYLNKKIEEEEVEERRRILYSLYNNDEGAKKILSLNDTT
ncbi:hypothetical protein AwDysgo_19540 [Bacteroidales bacterium]|nr:hypothetical protein AwDysgo_19540 [Bacteroidales bacterium]